MNAFAAAILALTAGQIPETDLILLRGPEVKAHAKPSPASGPAERRAAPPVQRYAARLAPRRGVTRQRVFYAAPVVRGRAAGNC